MRVYFVEAKNKRSTMYHNLQDACKEVLREKFTALNDFIRKEERSYIKYSAFT